MLFNYASKEVVIKIVYYGPALGGKTTNLEYIYKKTNPQSRGKLISLATESDRTLFFDLLPVDLGEIRGFNTKLQLYTVPGQVKYNATRKLVLKGVDAIVFVSDSNKDLIEANVESMENLKANLKEIGIDYASIPIILQFNKQDLTNRISDEELNSRINDRGFPYIKSCAINGNGVLETLKEISKLAIEVLNKKYEGGALKPASHGENNTDRIDQKNAISEKTDNASEIEKSFADKELNEKLISLRGKIISLKSLGNELLNELTSLEQSLIDLKPH